MLASLLPVPSDSKNTQDKTVGRQLQEAFSSTRYLMDPYLVIEPLLTKTVVDEGETRNLRYGFWNEGGKAVGVAAIYFRSLARPEEVAPILKSIEAQGEAWVLFTSESKEGPKLSDFNGYEEVSSDANGRYLLRKRVARLPGTGWIASLFSSTVAQGALLLSSALFLGKVAYECVKRIELPSQRTGVVALISFLAAGIFTWWRSSSKEVQKKGAVICTEEAGIMRYFSQHLIFSNLDSNPVAHIRYPSEEDHHFQLGSCNVWVRVWNVGGKVIRGANIKYPTYVEANVEAARKKIETIRPEAALSFIHGPKGFAKVGVMSRQDDSFIYLKGFTAHPVWKETFPERAMGKTEPSKIQKLEEAGEAPSREVSTITLPSESNPSTDLLSGNVVKVAIGALAPVAIAWAVGFEKTGRFLSEKKFEVIASVSSLALGYLMH